MAAVTGAGEDALVSETAEEVCPDSESQTSHSCAPLIAPHGHCSETQESSIDNTSSKTNVIHVNFMVSPAVQLGSPSENKGHSKPVVENLGSKSTQITVPCLSPADTVQVSKESVISKLLQTPLSFISTCPSRSTPKQTIATNSVTNVQFAPQHKVASPPPSEKVSSLAAGNISIPSTADMNLTGTTVYIIEEVGSSASEEPSTSVDIAPPKDLLKCDECDYSTHNKHYLKQHVDLVHSDERPYRCPFCDYAGKRSHSLKEHLVVHSNERPFQCSKCNATFRKKGHLTNHIKMHTPPATPLLVDCPVCGERVQERTGLYAHLRNCHSSENVYVCDVCDFATTSNTNIVLHLHSHNRKEHFRCRLCDFVTNEETSLAKHSESHAVSKPPIVLMKCTECGFTTQDNDILKEHMWQHINKPEIKPPSNVPTTSQEVTPQEQVTADTGDTTYRCGECYHETKEAYKFIAHMLTHKSVSRQTVPCAVQQDVPLVSAHLTPDPVTLSEDPTSLPSGGDNAGFTHDKSMGRFRCNICHYTCDYQRTIKAHVWKHSGHKDIDYPMFQNGPLSIYDDTPIVTDDGEGSKKAVNPVAEVKQNEVATPGQVESKSGQGGIRETVPRAVAPSLVKLLTSKSCEEVKCIKTAELHNKNNNGCQTASSKPSVENLANTIPMPVYGNPMPGAKSEGVEVSSIPVPVSMYVRTLLNQNPVTMLQAETTVPAEKPSTSEDSIANPVSSLCPSGSNQSTSFTVVHSEIGRGLPKPALLQKPVHLCGDSGYEVDMIRAAKRLCTEERKLGLNVVVESIQNVPAVSTFTGLRSQQGSPRGPDMTNLSDVANFANDMSCQLPNTSSDEAKLTSASGSERHPAIRESPMQVHSDATNPLLVVPVSDAQKMSPDIKDKMWSEEEIARLIASGAAIKKVGCNLFDKKLQMHEHSDKLTSLALSNQDLTDQTSVHEEQALTLLSLLKKGRNPGPEHSLLKDPNSEGCSNVQQEIHFSDTVIGLQEEQVMSVDEGSQTTEENLKENSNEEDEVDSESKPKAGICSSLLAVIEQLRERSKSESETDDGILQPLSGGKRKARRRNRKNSSEDGTPIEHMNNVEKLEDCEIKYRCKLCHYTNASILLMKQHMRLHKTKKPFECSLCDFVAESSETLQDHMIQHCKVRTYQCKLCPSAFNYKSQLRAHMRAHNEKDPFLCDSCDFETTNPITFRNHTRMHSDRKVYKCENCGDLCSTKSDLKVHQRDVCGMLLQVFVCDECTFETGDTDELQEHEKIHSKKQFRCSQCDYVSFSFANMRVHARIHEEVKEMKCDLCNFIAASSRSLKSHMKRHINDQRYVQQPLEQYKCNLCGYVCHHLPSLKSHMWRHASDKNYIYEFTNEVINAAIDFDSRPEDEGVEVKSPPSYEDETVEIKMEEEEDGGQEPCLVTFRCCQCGFETISKSNLNKHMKMHADIIQKTLDVSKTVPHHKGRPLQVE